MFLCDFVEVGGLIMLFSIYDEINNQYIDVFGKFSWVITEFASSSVGGDKSAWITSMFENIKNYPNINDAYDDLSLKINGKNNFILFYLLLFFLFL